MSESHRNATTVSDPGQQVAYDLMRARLYELFGPGGSFRIVLSRASQDEAMFAATVADTVAWEIAAAFGQQRAAISRHEVPADPQEEHDQLWAHVEEELLIRRTGPGAFFDDLNAPPVPVMEPMTGPVVVSQAARLSAVRAA